MEAKQAEKISQFLKKLPDEKFRNTSQMPQAKAFIWFANKGIGINFNEKELIKCFQLAGLKVPTNLGSRLRREYDIEWSPEKDVFL
ncbi:hypothetical protein ACFLXC_06675 [Chloroflexota bacterium]